MFMFGAEPEMLRIHECQKYNNKARVKGGCRIAQSPILTTTITLIRLKKKGYQSILDIYMAQPITLRTAVYETRTLGGVRGAFRQYLAEPFTQLAAGI